MIDTVGSPNDQNSMTNEPGMTNVRGQMTNEWHDSVPAISENRKLQTENSIPDMIPVRMLNEFTYCPRLGYLDANFIHP